MGEVLEVLLKLVLLIFGIPIIIIITFIVVVRLIAKIICEKKEEQCRKNEWNQKYGIIKEKEKQVPELINQFLNSDFTKVMFNQIAKFSKNDHLWTVKISYEKITMEIFSHINVDKIVTSSKQLVYHDFSFENINNVYELKGFSYALFTMLGDKYTISCPNLKLLKNDGDVYYNYETDRYSREYTGFIDCIIEYKYKDCFLPEFAPTH